MPVTAKYRVAMFLDLIGEGRVSMDQYGNQLADAIEQQSRAFSILRFNLDNCKDVPNTRAAKAMRYYWRYIRYPQLARRCKADIYHIVDQGYGHLVYFLDGCRTVTTCHDLMIFRMLHGSIPFAKVAPLTAAMYRISTAGLQRCRLIIADSR